ncbi:MAG: hypothetical protein WBC44_13925 [Planctomycetaceae bacterium]
MAGEVIRDVILKMRIEHADTKALDTARKQAGDLATNAATKAETATKKQTAAVRTLDQQLAEVRKEATSAADAAARGSKLAETQLKGWILQEKLLNEQIEKRNRLLTQARGITPKGPAGPGLGAGMEMASSALGKIALPVAIISMVPAVAQAIGGTMRSAAFSLFGTNQEAREKGSPFINSMFGTNQVQGSAVGDTAGLALNTGLARSILDSGFGDMVTSLQRFAGGFTGLGATRDFADRFQDSRNAEAMAQQPSQFDFLSMEIEARQKHLALWQQTTDRERSLLQKDLSSYEERIRINQQIIASEEARIDAAKEQFGLLDAQRKQDFIALAEKVKAGGVGSLSKSELELVQGNSAFTGILSEEAKKSADASGFQAIIDALDLDKNIRRAESQLEINVEQQQKITLELSRMDEAEQRLVEKLRTVQEEWAEEMFQRLQNEIRKAAQRGKPPAGPDF